MRKPLTIFDDFTRQRALDQINALDLSKPWAVTIAPKKAKRSLDQNALMWAWLTIIANDTGNAVNDVHEWCKMEFLPPIMVTINGKSRQIRRSTTDLNTADMTLYLDRIYAWAGSEMGILLPSPDDQRAA